MRDSVTNWIAVPGHGTVSRRAARLESNTCGPLPRGPLPVLIDSTGLKIYGAGQWQAERHGYARRKRHKWRKLHLGMDADSGQIVAVTSLSRLLDGKRPLATASQRWPRQRWGGTKPPLGIDCACAPWQGNALRLWSASLFSTAWWMTQGQNPSAVRRPAVPN